MNEENVISQDPPVNKAKVAEYLINLYDQNGYVLEEQKAFALAGSSDIKSTLLLILIHFIFAVKIILI